MRPLLRGQLLIAFVVPLFSLCACAQLVKGSTALSSGSTILLPEAGFTGGVLTGVVLGPNEKPLANAPVNFDGGVPITLSGEVIADESPAPQDCAGILARAQSLPARNREVITDANGRFAMCVRPDVNKVDVSLGDGSAKTSVPATGENPAGLCDQQPQFFQPGDRISLCQAVRKPTLSQGGYTWELPAVQAISPTGDRVLTTVRAPRDLQPGSGIFYYFDHTGTGHSLVSEVFKITHASLDRSKLHSDEGADFEYTAQFGDSSVHPCAHVTVAGPVMLVQAPPPQIAVDANGVGHFGGKIRATQVAPRSAVPFDIIPTIRDCNPGATQSAVVAPGEKAPGPGGVAGSDVGMKLTPAPAVPNPFVRPRNVVAALPPRTVAMNSPANTTLGPEHTMDSTNKYAKAPAPISACKFQTKTPIITSVEGVQQPTVFTQQQGLNYFTVHGCNFGTTPGHVYLVLHPDDGPGFPQPVELYPMQGNPVWTPDSIAVYMDPEFGGHLDQTGDVLRVVTANNLTAELPHQTFHAERVQLPIAWMPRSQVSLGTASDSLVPQFQTASSSQTNQLTQRSSSTDPSLTATVNRSVSNAGGPFTVQDDTWNFGALRSGFEVMYATPSYSNWNGVGCNQVSGKWGSSWDSATLLRVHVQGCFHQGTGYFRTSNAQYGLAIELRGPKGALPWPSNLK